MGNNRKKILIVDDEAITLDFFDVMLSKLGFSVEKAADGLQAIEKMRRFMPDLVLLDNLMPRMSGWELTKTLKNDSRYKDIPIIMFSAIGDVKEKVEGFALGVDDYITKPFNFSEVLARIQAVLRSRELYTQIVARESRLSLAEDLCADIKTDLLGFIKSVDDLDEAIASLSSEGESSGGLTSCAKFLAIVTEKSQQVRKQVAELDARLEKTTAEWESLKRNEIDLPQLEQRAMETPQELQ